MAAIAAEIGFPVVLKVVSPQITHKTDVGGVVLNLTTAAEVRSAFARITDQARAMRPDAEIQGVTVQRMVTAVHGVELILGSKCDPVFGPVIMVGWGGIAAELFQDRALELPPLDERLARRMLESLRSWPLLSGYRGRPVVDVDRMALSQALQNLILNSIKYSNGDPWMRISAENGGSTVKLTVEDRGIGISKNDLRQIFEPFYRAKEVVDAQIHGNGLGLSLVKQIAEAHGGRVTAVSEAGKGSRFTIEIPA